MSIVAGVIFELADPKCYLAIKNEAEMLSRLKLITEQLPGSSKRHKFMVKAVRKGCIGWEPPGSGASTFITDFVHFKTTF